MKLVALIPFLILSFECLSSVTAHVTDFVRFEHSGSYPLLTFINSTSKVYRVGLQAENEASLFSISKDSTFTLDSSSLVSHGSFVPFSLAGELFLSSFSVSQQNLDSSLGSLAITQSPSASISLSSSSFVDLPLSSNLGTFVSSGFTDTQAVENCVFSNVTLHDASETGTLTIVDKCRLENSVIENSQDTFYGLIVSGMSHRTISLFSSKNSTFTNCVRHNPLQFSTIQKLLDNGNCASYPSDGSTTTGQTFSCRSILERTYWNSGDYTFVDCTFSLCTTNLSGGAIYQTKSSYNSAMLNLTNCTFKNCHADQHGGAIFSEYTKNNIIHDTVFTNNTLPQGPFPEDEDVDHDSGAVLCNYTTTTLSVKRCTLEGNKAGGRGGGLYLGNIQSSQTGHLIESCTFIENEAKFGLKDSTGKVLNVAAGIGGGFYALPLQPVTFGECTFIKNNAGWHGAGLVYAYSRTPAYNSVFNWFVFHGNTAYAGLDIYIRAPTMKYTIVDQWTFTDAFTAPPQTDRYQYNTTANERNIVTNDAFLVVGPEVFVNYVAQNKQNTTSCREFDNNTNCQTIAAAIADGRKVSGDNSVWTINTIRVSLEPDNEYEEPTPVDIGDNIIHIAPRFVSKDTSSPLLNIKTSLSSAVYSIKNGVANFSKFEIKVTTALSKPLVGITDQGHLWFYNMKVYSETNAHESSLLSIGTGELYVSNTEISKFTLSNQPLISVDTKSTYQFPVRFVSTTISTIKRNGGGGSVFEITFDEESSTAYTITGLKCTSCTSTGTTGGAVSATITDGKTLTLSGCDFTGCSCAQSKVTIDSTQVDVMKGGAVYVNIEDSSSLIQLLSSTFKLEGSDVTGQYVYVDCKDGETVGWKDYWSGTLNADLTETERPYYWLDSKTDNTDDSRKHYSRSLYYFVFTPVEGGKQQMIVDVDNGADIRTCGWDSDLIPCLTLKTAFDQRAEIKTISLAQSANKYTTGTDQQFAVNSELTITGPTVDKANSTTATIAIDAWSSTSPVFQIRYGATTIKYVTIQLAKTTTAQFIYIPSSSGENSYDGSLTLNTVKITSKPADTLFTSSNYFLRATRGSITLEKVTVIDFAHSNNCFVGVSTSSHKSTLTIKDSEFINVNSEKGKGSVISLSTSCYCDITLNNVAFQGCTSADGHGAIYDFQALTDNTKSIVDKSTTFAFTTLSIDEDDEATKCQEFAFFEEPGRYFFRTQDFTLSDSSKTKPVSWKDLIGLQAESTYSDFESVKDLYKGRALGSTLDDETNVTEPTTPFTLLHLCFTPNDAAQATLYVAGKVGDAVYYFNMDLSEYQYKGCGWDDIPCMTIQQAVGQIKPEGDVTIQLQSSHTHCAETKSTTIQKASGKVTISSSDTTTVIKPVTKLNSVTSLFTINSATEFNLIQFAYEKDPEFSLFQVSTAPLTLNSVSFSSTSGLEYTQPIISVTGPTTSPLTLNSVQFSSSLSYKGEHGGHISVTCADGTIFKGQKMGYFDEAHSVNSTFCKDYWLSQTDGPSASLLHWIYKPTDMPAVLIPQLVMHVDSNTGIDVDTCGWDDLPCKTLEKAKGSRGTIETIQFDAHYTLTTSVTTPGATPLTLSGTADEGTSVNRDRKITLTLSAPSGSAAPALFVTNDGTLQFSVLNIKLNADTSAITSSGTLTFNDVAFTSQIADALTNSIITITAGTFTVTKSYVSDFKTLKNSLIEIQPDTAVTVSLLGSTFTNIIVPTDAKPSLLNYPDPGDSAYATAPSVTLNMVNDKFIKCQSSASTKGGAIYFAALDQKSKITLESSSIEECKCLSQHEGSTGRGGFLYIDCVGAWEGNNKLQLSVRMVDCKDNAADIGSGLFIQCDNLDNRLDSSIFVLNLTTSTNKANTDPTIRDSKYYSFWGNPKTAEPSGTKDVTYIEHATNNYSIDLLAFFSYYADTTIYVKSDVIYGTTNYNYEEKDCGTKAHPCKSVYDGSRHVLPSWGTTKAHIYLLSATQEANQMFGTQTSLTDLILSGEYTEFSESAPSQFTIHIKETGAKPNGLITTSGTVQIIRVHFNLPATTINSGTLFSVQNSGTLKLTGASFSSESPLPLTLITLTGSSLELDTVTSSALTFDANKYFISANGVSDSSYTVSITGGEFTDLAGKFINSENGATVYCNGADFKYTKETTIPTLFSLNGNSVIEGCELVVKEPSDGAFTLTLETALIDLKGAATLTLNGTTKLQHLKLASSTGQLIKSPSGTIILSNSHFTDLYHTNELPLFDSKALLTIDKCDFSSITHTMVSDLIASEQPLTITDSKFSFAADDHTQSLLNLVGGSTVTGCTFQHTEKAVMSITDTFIKLTPSATNVQPVTFTGCTFYNINAVKADCSIIKCEKKDEYVLKIVMNKVEFHYSSAASISGSFVSNDGDLELNQCQIVQYTSESSDSLGRTNDGEPTALNSLFIVGGSVTISGATFTGLKLSKPLLSLTKTKQSVQITSSAFESLSMGSTEPVLLGYTASDASEAPTCSVTGTEDAKTTFTLTGDLFLLTAPPGTTFSKCVFEAAAGTTLTKPLITAFDSETQQLTLTECEFTNVAGSPLISGTTGTIVISSCEFKPGTLDAGKFVEMSESKSSVRLSSSTLEGTGKLDAVLIKAASIQLDDSTLKNFDHAKSTATLLDGELTIDGCTFEDVKQDADAQPLLTSSKPITIENTNFTYPTSSTSMQKLMSVCGGTAISDTKFMPSGLEANPTNAVDVTGTLITVTTGTAAVRFDSCTFANIKSTKANAAVISCGSASVVFENTNFTFVEDAEIHILFSTNDNIDFLDSMVALAEAFTGSGKLNAPLFSVSSGASLVLSNSIVSDLTMSSATACIITTPEDGVNANSVTIDATSFKDVTQTDAATKPIFNTVKLSSFTITGCTFDCIDQTVNQPLLKAPEKFTITGTTFLLPDIIKHSILEVTKLVVFSDCRFYSKNKESTTTVTQPIIQVVKERTDLSLINCEFGRINAITTTKKVDGEDVTVAVPAIVNLDSGVTLTARNCVFTTVSSDIKIGQVFNARSSATFEGCVFNETKVNEAGDEVCYWNASIVQLSGGDCTLTNTKFHNISQGALGISGGAQVTIDGWDFADNHPTLAGYEKMQRNINCTERSVLVIKDDNGNIDSTTSLYLISDKCEVSYDLQKDGKAVNPPLSTFFIPTLSEANAKLNSDSELALGFKGTNIIPCSLDFEIFLEGDDEKPAFSAPLVSNDDIRTARRNQEQEAAEGSDEWPEFKTTIDLTNTPEVYGMTATGVRLSYGDTEDMKTQKATFDPPLVFPTARQAQGGSETEPEDDDKWAWWMWLIIGGGSFLFLLIVILCIVCCCCQDDEEKEEDEDEDMEDVKTVSAEALMALNTKDLLPSTAFKDFDANKVVTVEAMNTTSPYDKTVISAKKSIYYQIHNPSHRQDHNPFMWSATIAYHVCNGVQHILDTIYNDQPTSSNEVGVDVMKTILNTLSPHCIFAGDRDAILLGSVPNNYQVPVSANSKEGKTDFSLECQRYRSPEMTQHPNDDSRAMKESNAVFAIGFIMYEVFTGWLVFDGYPHSRVVEMVASGARPDLVLVRSVDSNFASIIEAATNMDAEQRPTIAQLLERIDMYLPNDLRRGAQQHFARSLMDDDDDL